MRADRGRHLRKAGGKRHSRGGERQAGRSGYIVEKKLPEFRTAVMSGPGDGARSGSVSERVGLPVQGCTLGRLHGSGVIPGAVSGRAGPAFPDTSWSARRNAASPEKRTPPGRRGDGRIGVYGCFGEPNINRGDSVSEIFLKKRKKNVFPYCKYLANSLEYLCWSE